MKAWNKIVITLSGIFRRGDKNLTLEEAMRELANCGCGIDCCNDRIVLTDKTTGQQYELFIDNGQLMIGVKDSGTYNPV